jgi:hypothetical protein
MDPSPEYAAFVFTPGKYPLKGKVPVKEISNWNKL